MQSFREEYSWHVVLLILMKCWGADKSLTRPTSQCNFYSENISFDACFVISIISTNIPRIMIKNITQEHQNLLSL
jgi:hypothetical protein